MHAFIRQTICLFRGGHSPRDAALAVLLGLLAGFLTGWNYSVVAVVLLALLLNVHTKALVISWCAGAGLAWAARGITWHVGHFLLDETAFGSLVASFGDGPLVALLGWDQYCLVGGAVIALVLAFPMCQAAARAMTPATAGTGEELPRPRLLRPWGWLLAGALGGVLAMVPGLVARDLVAQTLLDRLTQLNSAEATVRDVRVSLWNGQLEIDDLRLLDPRQAGHERLCIHRVRARFSPGELVRGRLHVDELTIENLTTQSRRNRPSADFDRRLIDEELSSRLTASPATDRLVLNEYLATGNNLPGHVCWLPEVLRAVEQLGDLEADQARARWRNRLLVDSAERPQRSWLGAPRPLVSVAKVRVHDLPDSWGLGARATLELTNLSSNPAAAKSPARLALLVPQFSARMMVDMNLADTVARYPVRIEAVGLRLPDLFDPHNSGHLVALQRGRVDLQGDGWINNNRCELNLTVNFHDVEAHWHDQPGSLLPVSLWNETVRRLPQLHAEANLTGTWSALELGVDHGRLVTQLKHQLRSSGEHRLAQLLESHESPQMAQSIPPQGPSVPSAPAASPSTTLTTAGRSEYAAPSLPTPSRNDGLAGAGLRTAARTDVGPFAGATPPRNAPVGNHFDPEANINTGALPKVLQVPGLSSVLAGNPAAQRDQRADGTAPTVPTAPPAPTTTQSTTVPAAPPAAETIAAQAPAAAAPAPPSEAVAQSASADIPPPPPPVEPTPALPPRDYVAAPSGAAEPPPATNSTPAEVAATTTPSAAPNWPATAATTPGTTTPAAEPVPPPTAQAHGAAHDANPARWHELPPVSGAPAPVNMVVGLDEAATAPQRPNYSPPLQHPYAAPSSQVGDLGTAPKESLPPHTVIQRPVAPPPSPPESGLVRFRRNVSNTFANMFRGRQGATETLSPPEVHTDPTMIARQPATAPANSPAVAAAPGAVPSAVPYQVPLQAARPEAPTATGALPPANSTPTPLEQPATTGRSLWR